VSAGGGPDVPAPSAPDPPDLLRQLLGSGQESCAITLVACLTTAFHIDLQSVPLLFSLYLYNEQRRLNVYIYIFFDIESFTKGSSCSSRLGAQ
jgi:hypothetical protein